MTWSCILNGFESSGGQQLDASITLADTCISRERMGGPGCQDVLPPNSLCIILKQVGKKFINSLQFVKVLGRARCYTAFSPSTQTLGETSKKPCY